MADFRKQVVYGVDGLSAWDANAVRRIWLDPATTSLKFFDAGGALRVLIDGLAVLLSFFDGAGVARCQIGNLPANGISQAHFGFRVNGPDNSPLYDTQGLIATMTTPPGSPVSIPTMTATSLTYAVVPSSSLTFSVARPINYLFQTVFFGTYQGPSGTFARVQLQLDGAQVGNEQIFQRTAVGSGQTWNGTCMYQASLAAGSHTIALSYKTDDVASNFGYQGSSNGLLFVLQLGG